MLRTDYRFTLTRDTDTFEVTPSGFFDGSFKDEQAEGQLFFRRKLDAELSFSGSDYAYIKTRYDTGNYCDTYELLIEKKGGIKPIYTVYWMGFFSMTDGKFDFERCRFNTSVTLQDKYSCILNNWETEVNILLQEKKIISSAVKSNLEFIVIADADGVRALGDILNSGSNITEFQCISIQKPGTVSFYVFAREAVLFPYNSTPVGSHWVKTDPNVNTYNINDGVLNYLEPADSVVKWVRRYSDAIGNPGTNDIIVNLDTIIIASGGTVTRPSSVDYTYLGYHKDIFAAMGFTFTVTGFFDLYIKKTYYNFLLFTQTLNYTSAIRLNETLTYVLNRTCPDEFSSYVLNSEFLTNVTNPVTGLASKTNNLYIIQKSDAKRPDASNPATKGNITFKQLMESLYNMFQLWWYINDSNQLVIVHQSEIENNLGLDITVETYIKTTAHKKAFQFDKSLLYRFEKWVFMESNGIDFVGQSIEYSELCTTKETVNKTKSYDVSIITTDLADIQTDQNNISDEGFALFSTNNTSVLLEVGAITGIIQLNGHLSTANLQDKYWRHNRILSTGKLNGANVTFISTQKIKKLVEQTIILCEDYDPLKQVTTELGPANVKESNFFPLDKRLVLNMSI